jgi:hypothetical protein
MITEEQKIDAGRLARYIEREQLVSVMSNTKWQRLWNVLEPIRGLLDFRAKDVREREDAAESWCRDIYYMFNCWKSIEWLEVRAIVTTPRGALVAPKIEGHTTELVQAVRQARVPFSRHEQSIRIWGYVRPGISPKWEV